MFEKIRILLRHFSLSSQEHHFKDTDPRLAAAALLVHAVSVDGEITDEERKKLKSILQDYYKLDESETKILISEARTMDHEAVDLYSFTHILKRQLSLQERLDIIALLWKIVYADGFVHEFEDNLIWRISELLGISARDRILLKKQVEKEQGEQSQD